MTSSWIGSSQHQTADQVLLVLMQTTTLFFLLITSGWLGTCARAQYFGPERVHKHATTTLKPSNHYISDKLVINQIICCRQDRSVCAPLQSRTHTRTQLQHTLTCAQLQRLGLTDTEPNCSFITDRSPTKTKVAYLPVRVHDAGPLSSRDRDCSASTPQHVSDVMTQEHFIFIVTEENELNRHYQINTSHL